MSTSLLYHAFGITGVKYTKTEFTEGQVLYHAEVDERRFRCRNCISRKVIKFGHKIRKIRLVPIGGKTALLMLTNYRLKCQKCGHIEWIKLPFLEGKSNCSHKFTRFMRHHAGDEISHFDYGAFIWNPELLRASHHHRPGRRNQ